MLSGSTRSSTTRTIRTRPVSTRSLSITAQCWRTRMTLRSVGSRYSSISRGASTGLAHHSAEEAGDGLGRTAQRRQDGVDRVRRRCGLRDDEEGHERYDEEPYDPLHVHHYRRSGSMEYRVTSNVTGDRTGRVSRTPGPYAWS